MESIDLQAALRSASDVWVEIWNGSGSGDYKHGWTLKAGIGDPHHKLMERLKANEPVIHIHANRGKGIITGVSFVRRNYKDERGYYFIALKNLTPLNIPLQDFKARCGNLIKQELRRDHPTRYPFSLRKNSIVLLQRGYVQRATKNLTNLFVQAISRFRTDDPSHVDGRYSALQKDLRELDKRKDIPNTTKMVLRDARLGQGRYRRDLDEIWESQCAVLGCRTRELLRASHIKKWSDSSDKERLDKNNGLLLSANIDVLFEHGLISFDDRGRMLVSPRLDASDKKRLQLGRKLSKAPWPALKKYLALHRRKYNFKRVKSAKTPTAGQHRNGWPKAGN